VKKPVECTLGLDPADAVLSIDEFLYDVSPGSAAIQHFGPEVIALR
jgi:hypothetical protein